MSDVKSVLLVDDEDDFRDNVSDFLRGRGMETAHARGGEEALKVSAARYFDAALVDLRMPGMDGLTLLGELKKEYPELEVVVMTGQGSVESAVEAMRRGAFHYLTKPTRMSELELVLNRAIERGALARENYRLSEEIHRRQAGHSAHIVAESTPMKALLGRLSSAAPTRMTVLIEGETGTGKEVMAEYLHRESPRRTHLMSIVNCGALNENLVDSELFGHERGAFTGAGEKRVGVIEVAHKGTLFLDEIGDISLGSQVRLLRFLEKGVIRRVGSNREFQLDVRVIAATNKNLETEVQAGRFREDLFHRLRVMHIRVPPLRERQEDILPLARAFLARMGAQAALRLSPAGNQALLAYPWPGNVRELAHTIERAHFSAMLSRAPSIDPEHLGLMQGAPAAKNSLVSLKENERVHILAVLEHFEGNRSATARTLGVSERHLYRLLKQLAPESSGELR